MSSVVSLSLIALLAVVLIALSEQRLLSRRAAKSAMRLGPYELGRKLGEGAMGSVYEARHRELGRRTALKVIKPAHVDVASLHRFEREAQLTSELSHPNTVALYDYGHTPDGIRYYAMEFIDGVTLLELVRSEGALPPERVLHLLRQIAASLAQAHRRGLIHRDIKHANVMICCHDGYPDCVKVLDFGLAKRVDAPRTERTTLPDLIVGTPQFMAPELTGGGRALSAAADIYAVGALGYFLLTGTVPFEGSSPPAILLAHLLEPPLPPSLRTRGGVPKALEDIILACLVKDPAYRLKDGSALLAALEACRLDAVWTSAEATQWWEDRGEVPVGPRRRCDPNPTEVLTITDIREITASGGRLSLVHGSMRAREGSL